jgi:hypothetical protein
VAGHVAWGDAQVTRSEEEAAMVYNKISGELFPWVPPVPQGWVDFHGKRGAAGGAVAYLGWWWRSVWNSHAVMLDTFLVPGVCVETSPARRLGLWLSSLPPSYLEETHILRREGSLEARPEGIWHPVTCVCQESLLSDESFVASSTMGAVAFAL